MGILIGALGELRRVVKDSLSNAKGNDDEEDDVLAGNFSSFHVYKLRSSVLICHKHTQVTKLLRTWYRQLSDLEIKCTVQKWGRVILE